MDHRLETGAAFFQQAPKRKADTALGDCVTIEQQLLLADPIEGSGTGYTRIQQTGKPHS